MSRPTRSERMAQVGGALRADLARIRAERKDAHAREALLRDALSEIVEALRDEALRVGHVQKAEEILEGYPPETHLVNINSPMFECAVDLALQELPPEDAEWRKTQFLRRLREGECP